jgi:polysaccharide biosynthesis transport protein
MDTNDSSNFNSTDAYAPPSSAPFAANPSLSRDGSTANAPRMKSRGVLSRVARRWRPLLLMWLVISVPFAFLISRLIQPTYEASSLVKIEPVDPELFGPLRRSENQSSSYLKTEVAVLTSDKVLEPVVANALVGNLPTIKMSQDPKREVREKMKVEIVENTNLIRIALELPNRNDAVTIVQAVVQSYFKQNTDITRRANRSLTGSLEEQAKKLSEQIEVKREALKTLYKNGKVAVLAPQTMLNGDAERDPTQPVLAKVPQDYYAKFIDRLAQCDFDCLEALSRLEAAKSVRARNQKTIDEELQSLASMQFKNDPRVVALIDQIDESSKLADSKGEPPPPEVLAARAKKQKLSKEYAALWESEFPGIRERLLDGKQGMLSDAKIRELELAVETATRTRVAYAKQLEKLKVIEKPRTDDTFDAAYLNHQLNSLLNREDQVKKHLEQLAFEAARDHYRVTLLDPASAPTTPTNEARLRYISAVPVCVFFLLLGLFLVQEIMAGRSHMTSSARTSD